MFQILSFAFQPQFDIPIYNKHKMNDQFTVDGFHYITLDNNEAQIGKGTTDAHNACDICPTTLKIPSIIEYNNIKLTVTVVGTHAFRDCNYCPFVFIPKTIKIIKGSAFNSVFANQFIFEEGSQLKEIEYRGIGWIHMKSFVLPPSVEILHAESFRGFNLVKHFYYCGTSQIDTEGVFSTVDYTKLNVKIHVTPQYPSNSFSNMTIYDHHLNCRIPFHCQTIYNKHKIISSPLFIIIMITI